MWSALKRLILGIGLIVGAAAVLLIADLDRRRAESRATGNDRVHRVAVFQLATRPIMDDLANGGIPGLARAGYADGRRVRINRYNAEGDVTTANAIAKAIVDKSYDLVLTYSTPCAQAMASANRLGRVGHVFAGVVDPFSLGIGMTRIGTMIPVREAILLAREMNPALRVLGIVRNPSEKNSELCTVPARAVCAELGITLHEAQVDNSAGVLEAAQSLVARGAEALYLGGDNMVDLAFQSLRRAADQGRIPVFTYSQVHGEAGALFGIGANDFEEGIRSGRMAGEQKRALQIPGLPAESDRLRREEHLPHGSIDPIDMASL